MPSARGLLLRAAADNRRAAAHRSQRAPTRAAEQDWSYWKAIIAANRPLPSPHPAPFTEPVTRNLIYHIWPVKGSLWQWNIAQLLNRIEIFNGRRIMGIVHDAHSENPDAVMANVHGHGFEFIVHPNSAAGEALTFPEMLSRVKSNAADEATFYAHAKGVRYGADPPGYIRRWAETQYRICLDNWSTVKDHLSRFPVTGCFKRTGLFSAHHYLTPWHYSGTFFWIRHHLAFPRCRCGAPQFYGGVEIWPAIWFRAEDTGCLFASITLETPYCDEFWNDTIDPMLAEWEQHRAPPHRIPPDLLNPPPFDGYESPRTEQHPVELEWLIQHLLACDVKSLLTIGAMHGGTEFHIARRFREAGRDIDLTTVDLSVKEALRDASQRIRALPQRHTLIESDSADPGLRARLAPHYDAVFIDGDHGYRGVSSDWHLALSLNPCLIGFHDIVSSDWHAACGCAVDRIWREIRADPRYQGRTEECIDGPGIWGGIGLVSLDV